MLPPKEISFPQKKTPDKNQSNLATPMTPSGVMSDPFYLQASLGHTRCWCWPWQAFREQLFCPLLVVTSQCRSESTTFLPFPGKTSPRHRTAIWLPGKRLGVAQLRTEPIADQCVQ